MHPKGRYGYLQSEDNSLLPTLGTTGAALLSSKLHSVILLCLLCFLPIKELQVAAQQFQVSGTIHAQPDFRDAGMQPATHFLFSANGCRWAMRLTGDSNRMYDYHEISYDGEDLYFITSFETLSKSFAAQGKRGAAMANAWVIRGQILRTLQAQEVGPVWLVFGSRCYFQDATSGMVEPALANNCPAILSPEMRVRLQRASWGVFDEFPHMLKWAVYFSDGRSLWLDRLGQPLPGEPSRLSPENTNVTLRVTETTNIGGLLIPISATIELFCREETNHWNTILAAKYEIRAESVSTNTHELSFPPPLPPGGVVVCDARFLNSAGTLSYLAQTGWVSDRELERSQSYKKGVDTLSRLRDARKQSTGSASSRFWVRTALILFLSTSIIPVLIGVRRGKTQQQNKRTTQ